MHIAFNHEAPKSYFTQYLFLGIMSINISIIRFSYLIMVRSALSPTAVGLRVITQFFQTKLFSRKTKWLVAADADTDADAKPTISEYFRLIAILKVP